MTAVSFTKEWIETDNSGEDVARECVETHHRNEYNVLLEENESETSKTCNDPRIVEIFQSQTKLTNEEFFSKGAPLGSTDDLTKWTERVFNKPAPVALDPQPILRFFTSNKFINEERILAHDGSAIDIIGIFSWFFPRYSLLTDSCRALQDYRISPDFSSCVKCLPGTGPTEDRRECRPCHLLVGQRYSDDGRSCERCPPGHWPNPLIPTQCLPCHQLDGVRYTQDRLTCAVCEAGSIPSADSTQCLDCSLPGHLLLRQNKRCLKCPEGTSPSPLGFKCSPCNLLEGVRFSEDRQTCIPCPSGTLPTTDGLQCLDCSGEYNFFTNKLKTRCSVCVGGQGATDDHFGCHRIDCQFGSWGLWGSCTKSCIGKDGIPGEKRRDRQTTRPKYGGKRCDRNLSREIRKCAGEGEHHTRCPEHGQWNTWSRFGRCSETCGGGTKTRTRSCNGPRYGGDDCVGDKSQSVVCNDHRCPEHGFWSDWTDWTDCPVTCGGGIRTRTRFCTLPKFGGDPCVTGPAQEQISCSNQPCPVHGVWDQWSSWGPCSSKCKGVQTRYRTCIEPQHGGQPCVGGREETRNCRKYLDTGNPIVDKLLFMAC